MRGRRLHRDDDVDRQPREFGGQRFEPLKLVVGRAYFDDEVASLLVTEFAQRLDQVGDARLAQVRSQDADARHSFRLRPRGVQRRRGGQTEHAEEPAAIHLG